jgi:hypothetical protein
MAQDIEFRVVLTANTQQPGTWDVLLQTGPEGLTGPMGSVQAAVTRQQLDKLRSQSGWPNLNTLKAIGRRVWQSVMSPELEAAVKHHLATKAPANRMRLVVSVIGDEPEPTDGTIRLRELPLEALFHDTYNFLAIDLATPVSRSLHFAPDRDATPVQGPLRILVVVSAPDDKPEIPGNAKEAIQNALQPLIASHSVELEFCEPPTAPELQARLGKQPGFHVLHYVGHGAFDIEGDDPTSRSYLCLEDGNAPPGSDPKDADTLDIMLRHTGVRLVVMTACSTAASTPQQVSETVGPFDGVAQRLVAGVSDVNAAVAMQFDLEADLAETFNRTFYQKLLSPGLPLDEIVTHCRIAMMSHKKIGHRCWVTPVLYWRCKEGRLFDLRGGREELDAETRLRLANLDHEIELQLDFIGYLRGLGLPPVDVAAKVAEFWLKVIQLQKDKCGLLGDAVSLQGGLAQPGQTFECPLTLRLHSGVQIGNVEVKILYPSDKLDFQGAQPGAATPGSLPLIGVAAQGERKVVLQNVSQGLQWAPGEHELARLSFQMRPGVTDGRFEVRVPEAKATKAGQDSELHTVNAIVLVS